VRTIAERSSDRREDMTHSPGPCLSKNASDYALITPIASANGKRRGDAFGTLGAPLRRRLDDGEGPETGPMVAARTPQSFNFKLSY
jgi:hypothetical protein